MGSQCSMQGDPSACSCSRCLQASVASAGDVRVLRSASSSRSAITATACTPPQEFGTCWGQATQQN